MNVTLVEIDMAQYPGALGVSLNRLTGLETFHVARFAEGNDPIGFVEENSTEIFQDRVSKLVSAFCTIRTEEKDRKEEIAQANWLPFRVRYGDLILEEPYEDGY